VRYNKRALNVALRVATKAISELVNKTRKLKIENRESRLYSPLLIN
jgi:hypothetical protein